MHWKEQLKAKIESLKDSDWLSLVNQDKYAVIRVDSPYTLQDAREFDDLIACVNEREFCGVDRGLLQLVGWSWDTKLCLELCLRKTVPWNVLPDHETGVFREIIDARGQPAHSYFDFNLLP